MDIIRVAGLWTRPVKGLAAIRQDSIHLGSHGITGNRWFMIIDENGSEVTQYDYPQLARLRLTSGGGDGSSLVLTDEDATESTVLYRYGGDERVTFHLREEELKGILVSTEANELLSQFLGKSVRLVRECGDGRISFGSRDSSGAIPAPRMAFTDLFPIHIASQSSLDHLNGRIQGRNLDEPRIPMDQFRADIVVAGAEPFDEDRWIGKCLFFGGSIIRIVAHCERCKITTTNQRTGERLSKEPMATLATFRREGKNVRFGVYAEPMSRNCFIRMGDEVTMHSD